MLAYFETVQVENAGVEVKFDARIRQNRRHFRVMPKTHSGNMTYGIPMDRDYGSRLNDGTFIPNHDDWNCVQDFANEGLLAESPEQIDTLSVLHLSDKGHDLCNRLREHKSKGGNFSDFQSPVESF